MENYDLLIPLAEIYNLKRDCEIINKFAQSKNPIIMIALIPFASLFCFEVLQYLEKKDGPILLEQSSRYSIEEIRHKVKFFDVRMNQLLNTIRNVDTLQNNEFINYMSCTNVGHWNAHQNIGIFFDQNNHIISNTHYGYYIFQDAKLIKRRLDESLSIFLNDPRIPPEEMSAYG